MRSKRPLLTWDRTPGFLCDWHIAGFFDSGLVKDPEPSLFDAKISTRWNEDHLAPFGGCESIRDVPPTTEGLDIAWKLLPLAWQPEATFRKAAAEFQDWEKALEGVNTDAWEKLYYALAIVESPREMDAELVFSGWDGCRLWVNGELRFNEHRFHHVILDMEQIPISLKAGTNSFLFQLDRDGVAARIRIPGKPGALAELRSVAVGEPPEGRAISTFSQLRRQALALKVREPFTGSTKEELKSWQASFRAHYRRCLGPGPEYPEDVGDAELVEEVQCDGYVRRRYHIQAESGDVVPAYVLIPREGRRNGRTVLLAHGHGFRFGMVVGVVPPAGPRRWVREYTGNYGELLARRGFVTAVMCERGFEERKDPFGGGDPCNVAHMRALAMGYTLPRLHLADIHLLFDFVAGLPEVDADRIGAAGLSGGGTLSCLAGAFDERLKAVAEFCGLCRYEDYATGGGCGLQVVPGLHPTGDTGEILSLIAPRALLLGQGRLDSTFNVIRVRSIGEDARRAYRAAGVEERLEVRIHDRAHEFDVDLAEPFLLKWL
jgi:dienelactone hydrolase